MLHTSHVNLQDTEMRSETSCQIEHNIVARTAPLETRILKIVIVLIAVAITGVAVWLFGFGGLVELRIWAAAGQRDAQSALAGALRALHASEPGALLTLCGLSFAYGVFHAAGPGHGKIVIGGYALGQRMALVRLVTISFAASLAQACTAIGLVAGTAWGLGWTRTEITDVAEHWMAPLSYGLMALVGLYLALRGGRRLLGLRRPKPRKVKHHDHARPHSHDHNHAGAVCESCGHRHGPTLEEVEGLTSLRDAFMLIVSIAIRPCTGAIFLLLLTWRMGILGAGVLGALSMGLGTALITTTVAVAAVGLRGGLLQTLATTGLRRLVAIIELGAGVLVVWICLSLLVSAL